MNRRTTNRRNIIRHRRRGTIPTLRWTMPTGATVKVARSPFRQDRASYDVRHATVYGPWPVDHKTMREVQRWS
jgi:hypothetical protein